MEVFVIMKKCLKLFYANLLYTKLLISIEHKDYKWFSSMEEEIKRSKVGIRRELFKLVRTHYYRDFNELDPESRVLLLDFMKRHNIIIDNKENIEL